MRLIINGANGRMGKEIVALAINGYKGAELVAGVDVNPPESAPYHIYRALDEVSEDADCIIDFSHHSCTRELVDFAIRKKMPLMIATTGHSAEELEIIKEASKQIPIFISANMSVGVALLCELAKIAAKTLPEADIEIIEKHHNRKLDAPSGTALLLADEIKTVRENSKYVFGRGGQGKRETEEIGIHAVRIGNIVGEHEIIVGTDTQTITLKHEAHSRALFAEGAITAALFLYKMPSGLYNMHDMIK